jgi:HEAT repeat protein
MHGKMHVDQTFKGSINSPSVEFIFELPDAPIGYKSISPSSYRIVFLNKTQSGYSLTSPYYPTLCAGPGVRASGTDILANLSNQLDAVLESAGGNYQDKREALNALKTLRTPIANAALKRALGDKALDLRLLASAALLERNDISGLSIGESVLTTKPEAASDYLLHNIAYAISEGIRDPRAVPTLGKLLQLPNVEARRAAASALWHTGAHSAVPFLVLLCY